MAGRLRGQLKKLEAIREAADALSTLIFESAPKGLITNESIRERAGGYEQPDAIAELWHVMLDDAFKCERAAMDLEIMLQERIERLPTYRPPVNLPALPGAQAVAVGEVARE